MENLLTICLIIGAIPSAFAGLWWIAERTRTKKDDNILERIEK